MSNRFIRAIVCLCMAVLSLQGWGAVSSPCHEAMGGMTVRMAPSRARDAVPASPAPSDHLHASAHPRAMPASCCIGCVLCAACGACTPLMTFAPMRPVQMVLFYRVGSAVRSTYTSTQSDVPHPPPRQYA